MLPTGLRKARKLSNSLPELPGGEDVEETDINDILEMSAAGEQRATPVNQETVAPLKPSAAVAMRANKSNSVVSLDKRSTRSTYYSDSFV